jgi:hypothetical protein
MGSWQEKITGPFSRFRREEPKEIGPEVAKKAKADEKIRQEASLSMRAAFIKNQFDQLAARFPHLMVGVPDDRPIWPHPLSEVGSMLTSFVDKEEEEAKRESMGALVLLVAVKGPGSVVTRTKLFRVVTRFHPDAHVRAVGINLACSCRLTSKEEKMNLLHWSSQHDEDEQVRNFASLGLQRIKE